MDERVELLVSLGASTAANCVPCFEHYYRKAFAAGISGEEIRRAVELACKVKTGGGYCDEEQHPGDYRPGDAIRTV